jgi:hypothetical protein cdiviTM7_00850
MSRVATAELGLAPAAVADNNGGDFDVFSSLRDGAGGEDFSSGISEAVANDASQLDLVAVAGGEAELDVAISDNDTKEDCTPINPEFCRNFGSAACFGCVNLGLCQDRQAAMKKEPKSQEGVETIRDRLLAPDSIDDLDEDGRGELVLPSPVRLCDQRNTEETSETPIETGHVDVVSKVANETGEAADDSGRVDLELKAIHNNLNVLPEKNVQSQSKPMDISPQEIETKSVDDDNSPIVEQGEMSASDRLPVEREAIITKTPQDKIIEDILPYNSRSEKAAVDSTTLSREGSQASDRSNKANYRGASGIQSSNSEQNIEISLREQPAQRVKKEQFPSTGDIINTVSEEASLKRKKAIDIDPPIDFVASNDTKIQHNLPQKTKSEPVVNQADIKPQISTAGDVCCNDVVEHADDKGEIWAEDQAVFLTRRQELSTLDLKPVSTEKALAGPPTEISNLCKEVEGLYKITEAEPVVRDDLVDTLMPNIAADCDDELVEQLPIASEMSVIGKTADIEGEVIVAISKERETSRKKCETVLIKSPENGPSPVKEEVLLDEFSGLEIITGMTEERKVNVADKEVLEAKIVDSELLRQDKSVMDEGDVTQTYTGETIVDGDIPATDVRPLSGLWTDDSRLNPEEESASTAQSSADKTLLVSQLFGMLVVAMCVVCGRQARAIPNS